MKDFLLKNWYWVTGVFIAWVIGFVMGRSSSNIEAEVIYTKGDTIHDTVPSLIPVNSKIPDNPDLPTKTDTVWMDSEPYPVPGKDSIIYQPFEVFKKVDTSQIIKEYITENKYDELLFDNDNGKLRVKSTVQYNKMQGIGYDFTPIQKQTTILRKRTFTPFVEAKYGTLGQASAGVGLFIKNVGVGASYVRDLKTGNTGYEGGILIKF